MERYTVEQREEIIKIHLKTGEHFAETVRKCRTLFGHSNAPTRNTVVNLIKKFKSTGSVENIKSIGRPRTARSNEIIANVCESLKKNPSTSIRRRSQQLGISRSSLQRILTKELHLFDHKDDTEEVHIEGENSEGSENGSIKQSMQEIDEMYESNSKQIKLSPSSRLKSANYPPQDEFQLFGQSIAVQLKNLSTKRSIYAQNEIQAILTRHRLLDLHDKENQNTEILNQDFSEKIKTEIVDQEIENREISNSDIFKPETNLNQSTDTSCSEELMGNEDIKIEYNYDEYHLNDNSMITASEKNSRKCYTAAEKLLVIEYAETNGNRDASRHFSVNESNVRFWRKNKEAIQVLPRKKKASRGHPPSFPHLENALVKWVVDRRQMGIRVPRIDIKLKALELKESLLGTEEFKASYGWAVRFMKRHGLDEEEEDLGSLKRDNEEGCGVSVADRTILEPSDTNNTKFLMDAADIKVETDS
ncbi:PREDICTED: uncharacterized protein LOC108563980 isoform X3 [Nicrophorus vespilloides]|uniref:Uncharacterized protein LOC108563980 isoform X3 n=1 Tax=Nicrophorus vespilloides TaxID=110193 RepID=A0ABM1MUT2_NICVS|nr:PREDICTED: uncharacterized protein LOC108563980 isoform X3 [Nicrophorus vespilloides]